MTAKIMKEKGFIDTILEAGKGSKASFDLSIFNNLPNEYKDEKQEPTEREIEKALRDVGVPQNRAKAILAGCKKLETQDIKEAAKQAGINELKAEIEKLTSRLKQY